MVRQAVDEALNAMPTDQKQTVKLAYFGGLTNREIADRLGVREGAVRRLLRESLAAVSAFLERGRKAGRRAVYAVVGWLTARSVIDISQRSSTSAADHVMQAAAAVTVGVVAAAVLVANPASPAAPSQTRGGGVQTAAPAAASPLDVAKPAAPSAAGSLSGISRAAADAPRVPSLRVRLPLPVATPSITLPKVPGPRP